MTDTAKVPEEAARATELERLLSRLRDEHRELLKTLDRLDEAAELAERKTDERTAMADMQELRPLVERFLAELEKHALIEEDELIPLIDDYYHRKRMPTMTASIWVMEKDHELAVVYLQSCLGRLKAFDGSEQTGTAAEAIHCLMQGCSLMKEHFVIEEKTLFPLAEELLTDMDFLFA